MKKLWVSILLACFGCLAASAQRHELLSERIASLQVVVNDDWTALPVVTLGAGDVLNVGFDDLSHTYHRYCYKIEHCEADWTPSEGLFESDYCQGFASGNTIDDLQESVNTNQLYTHYQFCLPNSKCRIKMSGNYKLTVYDENEEDKPVLVVCFMVVEPAMTVGLGVTTNTDLGVDRCYQQVDMKLDYGQVRVTNPASQIMTVVMQNGRWDNAVVNAKPQMVSGNGLAWTHNRDLIFQGGNEYRKFEMLDVTHTTMGLESVEWDGTMYHAYVWPDEPRPSYVYDEDANGAFLIRNSDNVEIDNTCEYLMVHFRLNSQRLPYDVWLNGAWTYDSFAPKYLMTWNDEQQLYEADVWLKQGYYNYQYLTLTPEGSYVVVPSEGNFYQTENQYQALVYYRAPGGRTDRLVGYANVRLTK